MENIYIYLIYILYGITVRSDLGALLYPDELIFGWNTRG